MSAYEVSVHRTDADPLALRARRLGWWRKLAIVVSFTHMMTTIALFGNGEWYAGIVAGAMTLLIDLAVFEMIEYQLEAHRADWRPSGWIGAFLVLAIVLSISLNAGYLWNYRPNGWDAWLTIPITAALAVFVPGWIAIAAVMSAELHSRQTAAAQAAQAKADAVQTAEQARADAERRATESEQGRALAVQLAAQAEQARELAEQESARLRTLAEQSRTLAEHSAQETAHCAAEAERWRTEAEQFRTVAEQEHARAEHIAHEAAQWRTAAEQRPALPDTPPDATITIGGRAYSVRAVAEATELSPSTLNDRLAKVRAKE